MPRKCVVVGCHTNRSFYEPKVRFFPFPREDDVMRERWRDAIGRSLSWKIPTLAAVCQKHFAPHEITSDRRMEDTVVPTLNLPAQKDEESPRQTRKSKRRQKAPKQVDPDVVEAKSLEIQEPVEHLVVEQCRFCVVEMEADSGLDISSLKETGQVRESIWQLCLVGSDSSLEDCLVQICNRCWEKMETFERFVANCEERQKSLYTLYSEQLGGAFIDTDNISVKDEPVDINSDFEFEQVLLPEARSDEDEQNQQAGILPPLEGLSIDEMIEVLDKIPPSRLQIISPPDEECWDCGQTFPSRGKKKEHRKTCSAIGTPESLRNKGYTCELCKKQINTRAGYRVHLIKIHGDQAEKGDDCPQELKRLQSRKKLQCPLCSDRFQQLHQLKYHLRTHKSKMICGKDKTKSKEQNTPVTCEVCGKTFQNPFYMETHMKFHLKKKDFACGHCEKRFYTKPDLKDHVKMKHAEHSLLCGVCGKSFGSKHIFRRHMNTHDESRNTFKCPHCPKGYPNAYWLKHHVMRHTGEKAWRCEICGHAFRFRYMLTQHKIRIHKLHIEGVKLYKRRRRSLDDSEDITEQDNEAPNTTYKDMDSDGTLEVTNSTVEYCEY